MSLQSKNVLVLLYLWGQLVPITWWIPGTHPGVCVCVCIYIYLSLSLSLHTHTHTHHTHTHTHSLSLTLSLSLSMTQHWTIRGLVSLIFPLEKWIYISVVLIVDNWDSIFVIQLVKVECEERKCFDWCSLLNWPRQQEWNAGNKETLGNNTPKRQLESVSCQAFWHTL